jgi:hypothetical protein
MTKNVQNTVNLQKQSQQQPDPLSDVNSATNSNSSYNISSFQNAFNRHVSYPKKSNELPGIQNELDNLTSLDLDVPATSEGIH